MTIKRSNQNAKGRTILSDNIAVEIQDQDFRKIGDATSLAKAARQCYINHPQKIWRYLFLKCPKRESRNKINGIKSSVTGKRFHFKLKQE